MLNRQFFIYLNGPCIGVSLGISRHILLTKSQIKIIMILFVDFVQHQTSVPLIILSSVYDVNIILPFPSPYTSFLLFCSERGSSPCGIPPHFIMRRKGPRFYLCTLGLYLTEKKWNRSALTESYIFFCKYIIPIIRKEYALFLNSTTLMKNGNKKSCFCIIHCNKKTFFKSSFPK